MHPRVVFSPDFWTTNMHRSHVAAWTKIQQNATFSSLANLLVKVIPEKAEATAPLIMGISGHPPKAIPPENMALLGDH